MNKLLSLCLITVLTVFLAACSQTAEPINKKEDKNKITNEQKGTKQTAMESELTLQDVFEKSLEANKELNSFSSKMNMKQQMEVDGEKFDINMNADMKFIMDPVTLHQKMTTSMDMGESNGEQNVEMEAYLTTDGFYLFEPTEAKWLKLPVEMTEQLLQLQNEQTNPAEQLEQLKTFVDDFDFKQDESQFILHLNANGEKFNDFFKETAINSMPPEMQNPELLEGMNIKKVEYEIFIDKETFLTTKMNIKMETVLDMEGQKMNMVQNISSDFADFNKIDSIKVPQDALDNAEEIDMGELEGE